jgi:hypothetical protein
VIDPASGRDNDHNPRPAAGVDHALSAPAPAARELVRAERRAAAAARTLTEIQFDATLPRSAALADDPSRAAWLWDLERSTAVWRTHRAAALRARGDRLVLVQAADDEIADHYESIGVRPWYESRAAAHLERWERLAECQQRARVTQCDSTDAAQTVTVLRCDHWRLCLSCRGARAQRYRARFDRGRSQALDEFDAERTRRTGSRWSEKFVTLTIPHSAHVGRDVAELALAWPSWRARVAKYLKARGIKRWRSVPYWRSLEVTASTTGHAHYHVWMLAPFLPKALAAHWWALSLSADYRALCPRRSLELVLRDSDPRQVAELRQAAELDPAAAPEVAQLRRRIRDATRAGDDAAELRAELRALIDSASWLYAPIVDVRRPPANIAAELVKYIVKDLSEDGPHGRIDPTQYATIYAALDGSRAVATSAHLIDNPRPPARVFCECCGVELVVRFVTACSVRCMVDHAAHGPSPPKSDPPTSAAAAT